MCAIKLAVYSGHGDVSNACAFAHLLSEGINPSAGLQMCSDCVCARARLYVYECVCVYMNVCMCLCMCALIYVCVHACLCVSACVLCKAPSLLKKKGFGSFTYY